MVVDFVWRRVPELRVATIVRVGPWKEDNLKDEFTELTRWARRRHLSTGRWVFLEHSFHRWEACLEIGGRAAPEGRIRVRTLPGGRAASVVFDPDRISSRIVYHALGDWTRARRRDGTIREVTSVREVYPADPWKYRRAWSHCEVQFGVRR